MPVIAFKYYPALNLIDLTKYPDFGDSIKNSSPPFPPHPTSFIVSSSFSMRKFN